jgi:heat shock protein HslJ
MNLSKFSLVLLGALLMTFIPASFTRAASMHDLMETNWQLVSFGDENPIILNTVITLVFDDGNSFGGSAGCNSYGGTYEVNGNEITFGETVSTMMACLDEGIMEQEQAYLNALNSATRYEIADNRLVIEYGDGQTLTFIPASTLRSSSWQLVSYGPTGDKTLLPVETSLNPITLSFGDENQFTGSAGCNEYGGIYDTMDKTLTFREIFSTRRACASTALMEQEQRYFAALETATSFQISENELHIQYGLGEQLTFMRIRTLHDSQWQLASFGQTPDIVPESVIMLEFGDENRFAGIGGCNNYGGSYETQGDRITFSEIFSTRRSCADAAIMQQELAYFTALESATGYQLAGDQLIIEYGDGQQLTFIRITTSTHVQ